MPCPQAESMLAAGQNKPATESTEPLDVSKEDKDTGHYVLPLSVRLSKVKATNLTILLLSLYLFFCCWHVWKPFLLCAGVCMCALGGCVRALLGGACVTWYGLSQYAAGGLKQKIHLSFWILKRLHLNLGYPTEGLFLSARIFRGSVVSPHQTGWLGLTAILRFPPAAQVRGCAEVSMSPLGYYGHATLIQRNCSGHPEVKQM